MIPTRLLTRPWNHQLEAIPFALEKRNAVLELGMGCISGDAEIVVHRCGITKRMPLRDLHRRFHSPGPRFRRDQPWRCRSLKGDRFGQHEIVDVMERGTQPVLALTMSDGKRLVCTVDHHLATADGGWIRADQVMIGGMLLANGQRPTLGINVKCTDCPSLMWRRPSEIARCSKTAPRCRACYLKFCSTKKGSLNHAWTGGKFIDKDGYVRLRKPGHPRANRSGHVYEHIVVMEEKLGRTIGRSEEVHHKNEVRSDNDPNNLEVLTHKEHSQRHDPVMKLDGGSTINGGRVVLIPKPVSVVSVEDAGQIDVYDIEMAAPWHNFVASGMVVHNSGKTRIAVGVAHASRSRFVLVLCPTSVVGVWRREFPKHSEGFRVVTAGKGDTAKRAEMIVREMRLSQARGEAIVVVVNHEASWVGKLGFTLARFPWDLFIVDESHRLKSPSGRMSLQASKIALLAKRRMALTGTLAPHSPLDLWAQFRIIDRRVFQPTFTEFKRRYGITAAEAEAKRIAEAEAAAKENGVDVEVAKERAKDPKLEAFRRKAEQDPKQRAAYGVMASQVVEFKNVEELRRRYRAITFTRTTGECVDLPPLIEQEIVVELEPKVLALYRDLERDMYAKVDTGEITAANALVKLLRLQQLAGGVASYDDGRVERVSDAKLRALFDLVEDRPRGKPFVVFSRFTPDVQAVIHMGEAMGLRCGEVSSRRKDLTPHAQIPEGIDLMSVQIQSGGTGVDMSAAAVAAYLSKGFSLGEYLQSVARLHRPGQLADKVVIYHILADVPVERKTQRALRLRQDLIKAVLHDRSDGTWEETREMVA